MADLTYEDFKDRVDIKSVLEDAGYHFHRRDGLRYPCFVRLDDHGHRIRGDKFIVTANGKCCFRPPEQRNYNVISFIKEHPEYFQEYSYGMDKDRLVNLVCRRLLGQPAQLEYEKIQSALPDVKFDVRDYEIVRYDPGDKDNYIQFYPYFKQRGIDLLSQAAFSDYIVLSTNIQRTDGRRFTNIAFPFRTPSSEETVGLEVRSVKGKDGKSFKGKALGTDSVNGLWIASPHHTPLQEAKHILWFESAFDAMAYYQIMRKSVSEDKRLVKAELKEGILSRGEARQRLDALDDLMKRYNESIYLSTGGSPSEQQFKGILKAAPTAEHYLCFDSDKAGQMYCFNFLMHSEGRYFNSYSNEENSIAFIDRSKPGQNDRHDFDPMHTSLEDFCREMGLSGKEIHRMAPSPGYKDWNDQLLDIRQEEQEEQEEQDVGAEEREIGLHR